MKNDSKIILLAAGCLLLLMFSACNKVPGDGGLAAIHGKVYAYKFDKYYNKIDSGFRANATVYLSYGSHTWEDQNAKTSYSGEYTFPYLHTGDYTVWVLNLCDTCNLHQAYDIAHVTINSPRETVEVRDLINYY